MKNDIVMISSDSDEEKSNVEQPIKVSDNSSQSYFINISEPVLSIPLSKESLTAVVPSDTDIVTSTADVVTDDILFSGVNEEEERKEQIVDLSI